nr:MAG TPA: hypothetical protein [Caudoviricetes sp.]
MIFCNDIFVFKTKHFVLSECTELPAQRNGTPRMKPAGTWHTRGEVEYHR